MHDIAVIDRLNDAAVKRAIPQLAEGKAAILKWDGLHFLGATTHESLEEAEAVLVKLTHAAPITVRYEIRHGTQSH